MGRIKKSRDKLRRYAIQWWKRIPQTKNKYKPLKEKLQRVSEEAVRLINEFKYDPPQQTVEVQEEFKPLSGTSE